VEVLSAGANCCKQRLQVTSCLAVLLLLLLVVVVALLDSGCPA
jgi:hypothetical protein